LRDINPKLRLLLNRPSERSWNLPTILAPKLNNLCSYSLNSTSATSKTNKLGMSALFSILKIARPSSKNWKDFKEKPVAREL